MAVNKNFVIKNGVEVRTDLIVGDANTGKVGIATTTPRYTLHVNGGIGATDLNVLGVTTTTSLYVSGVATAGTLLVQGTASARTGIITNVQGTNLNYSGIGTISTLVGNNLNYSGVSTFNALNSANLNVSGITTTSNLIVNNGFDVYDGESIFHGNVTIQGNVTIGGTSTVINAASLVVEDKDLVLGYTTSQTPNNDTANHGGIAIASTEGYPLVSLAVAGINTFPDTYKQIMWVKENTMGAGTTAAWLFNYSVGIGSTNVPNGVRLAVGAVQVTNDTITAKTGNLANVAATNINASGITSTNSLNIGATQVISSGRQLQNIASLDATTTATIESAIANAPNTFTDLNVTGITTLGVTSATNLTAQQLNVSGISTLNSLLATTVNVSGASTLGIVSVTQINASGIITASSFIPSSGYIKAPDGTNSFYIYSTTGNVAFQGTIGASQLNSASGNKVIGLAGTDAAFNNNVTISGVTTIGTVRIGSGIVTASSGVVTYYGDGSKLSNIVSGVGIQSGGNVIGYGFTTLNFVGTGNTFSVNGNTVNISIAGGGGNTGFATYNAGIATASSVGINTTNLDDPDLTGIGNSFKGLYVGNGMIIVDNALNGNHYIGTNFNGLMAGPVTINGTLTVDGNYVVV